MYSNLSTAQRIQTYTTLKKLTRQHPDWDLHKLKLALKRHHSRLPSDETIGRWMEHSTNPARGVNLYEPKPSKALSTFLGAWLGDGWADDSDGGKRFLLQARSKELVEIYAKSATELLRKKRPYKVRHLLIDGRPAYKVKVTSFQLYEFATKPFSELKPFIAKFPIEFIRTFAEAEGNPASQYIRDANMQT